MIGDNFDVRQLKQRINELEHKILEYEDKYYGLCCDDMYEYLIVARSEAMLGKIKDAMDCSADYYRKMQASDETMQKIFNLLPGKNSKEKKDALRDFLKENPHYRTKDPALLHQRLRLAKKYGEVFSVQEIPEHPIKDAIDESNTPLPLQKDDGFIE